MLMDLHVIYTRSDRILLSRRPYESWRHIQDDVADYMASLGPWSSAETIEYLSQEHPELNPSASHQVGTFLASAELLVELRLERNR
ncbi:conserved hypothetical protein [Paraburkholderia piptadeniae]|uniref:Uncharacterized protein n=1 Tax=Paraburkholderia piptadeniae TaxID=1701573 RepID=A0A1N7SFA1_9BURK|nr:conserved hypothetical protein [Paraburkholderia piptadeniae]